MTETEAIEILEGALVHFGNANLLHRAMKVGIDSLKEKQERNKGCNWCYEYEIRGANYCPMCGKKLEVQP